MSGLVDKSVNFGLQNFLFVQLDETGGTYYYYGFQTKKGSTLIMRTDTDTNNARYWIGTGDFTTNWTAKATKTYALPTQLKDTNI